MDCELDGISRDMYMWREGGGCWWSHVIERLDGGDEGTDAKKRNPDVETEGAASVGIPAEDVKGKRDQMMQSSGRR